MKIHFEIDLGRVPNCEEREEFIHDLEVVRLDLQLKLEAQVDKLKRAYSAGYPCYGFSTVKVEAK